MNKCFSCGKPVDENMKYCPSCGEKINNDSTQPPQSEGSDIKKIYYIEKKTKLIQAEQLCRIGETEDALKLFVEYTNENPLDWETQIRVADICESAMKIYTSHSLEVDETFLNYSFLRRKMLNLAQINAPQEKQDELSQRLNQDFQQNNQKRPSAKAASIILSILLLLAAFGIGFYFAFSSGI